MKRLTYANVMASIAMFVALGGTAFAAATIDSRDVVNGSLTNVDIRDGSLLARDFKAGQLTAKTRWVLINEAGDIEDQSGGFTVLSKPGINDQPTTNPNIYVNAGTSLVGKGLSATIALQNKVDRNADGAPNPNFNGDASIGRCNSIAVNCVPTGTNVDNVLVVRALADNATASSETRRVWVQVTP